MTGKVVFLLEEPSLKHLLEGLLPRLCPGLNFLCIAHEGKQDLEKSIPRKLRAWREPGVRFLVARDNDGGNCVELKSRLADLCAQAGRGDSVVRIACQEIEAWYLGDFDALADAYGDERLRGVERKARFRNPDSVHNPSTALKSLVPEFQKVAGARRMAAHLTREGNRSSSFHALLRGIPVASRDGRLREPIPMSGTLHVVATPIGNLEDLSPRAARALREASLIAAEDTRRTRKLLDRIGARTRLLSYHRHNATQRTPALLDALREGDVALVTDAGAPSVSDPGAELAAAAAQAGFAVVSVPGPSAVTAALAVSGFPADAFHFLGFLPRTAKARRAALAEAASFAAPLVLFEAPHRLQAALADVAASLGDRRVAVCRELTKAHEEVFRGAVSEAIAYFDAPRGEFAIVVEGAARPARPGSRPRGADPESEERIAEAMASARASGLSRRDAAAQVAREFSVTRRAAYAAGADREDASRRSRAFAFRRRSLTR